MYKGPFVNLWSMKGLVIQRDQQTEKADKGVLWMQGRVMTPMRVQGVGWWLVGELVKRTSSLRTWVSTKNLFPHGFVSTLKLLVVWSQNLGTQVSIWASFLPSDTEFVSWSIKHQCHHGRSTSSDRECWLLNGEKDPRKKDDALVPCIALPLKSVALQPHFGTVANYRPVECVRGVYCENLTTSLITFPLTWFRNRMKIMPLP